MGPCHSETRKVPYLFHTFGKGMEGGNPRQCLFFHTFHTFHTFFLPRARARMRTRARMRARAYPILGMEGMEGMEERCWARFFGFHTLRKGMEQVWKGAR
jgi:hypothetical protein